MVRVISEKLQQHLVNTKPLAKLAEGDLIAREACYNKKCMTDFTNRYKSYTKPVDKDK